MSSHIKNILITTGIIIMFILAYKFAFSRTLELKEDLEKIQTQLEQKKITQNELLELQKKNQKLDSLIKKRNTGESIQNQLLAQLNKFSDNDNCKIIDFKEPHTTIKVDSTQVSSFQFTLQGKYRDLENLIYQLENNPPNGNISHLHFKKKYNYQSKKIYLELFTLYTHIN